MSLGQKFHNRILALFDLRLVSASRWRKAKEERDRLELLAASSMARGRILELANLLVPQSAVGHSKVRIGSKHDGGYICLNDFEGITAAFSFGIGHNDDWDIDIAERGIVVFQLDHTVTKAPRGHSNCRFLRTKAVPGSIPKLIAEHSNCAVASVILKIDVDNDEWNIFSETTDENLKMFSQIICEFHGFGDVVDNEWYGLALRTLKKLNSLFAVVHVHGNNFLPWMNVGNVPFPQLLEVTYANRDRYGFEPTDETFPTGLDTPNDLNSPDLFLGRFVFQGAVRNESHTL